MELVGLMIKYYFNTAVRAGKLAVKNWPVMFVLLVYSVILTVVGVLAGGLYFIGGIIIAIVSAACISSYLYLIENIIYSRIAGFNDFKNSFTPYLRKVINITFYIWIATYIYSLLSRALMGLPFIGIINMLVELAVVVVLNPLPEIIYQTNYMDLGAIGASYEFMKENFIEWLVPNIILLGAIYYLFNGNMLSFSVYAVSVVSIVKYIAGLFLLLFTMVFRGILFRFLNESTRRSRVYKLKMLNFK